MVRIIIDAGKVPALDVWAVVRRDEANRIVSLEVYSQGHRPRIDTEYEPTVYRIPHGESKHFMTPNGEKRVANSMGQATVTDAPPDKG